MGFSRTIRIVTKPEPSAIALTFTDECDDHRPDPATVFKSAESKIAYACVSVAMIQSSVQLRQGGHGTGCECHGACPVSVCGRKMLVLHASWSCSLSKLSSSR